MKHHLSNSSSFRSVDGTFDWPTAMIEDIMHFQGLPRDKWRAVKPIASKEIQSETVSYLKPKGTQSLSRITK